MTAGARAGITGAFPALAGIILGTLAMTTVVVFGAGAAFAAEPRLRTAITAAGCLYLAWLGLQSVRGKRGDAGEGSPRETRLPSHAAGLFFFQFLNPKAWAMVLTVTSGVHSGIGATRIGLSRRAHRADSRRVPGIVGVAWGSHDTAAGAPACVDLVPAIDGRPARRFCIPVVVHAMRVLALPGSLRRGSYNRRLLEAAVTCCSEGDGGSSLR